MTNANDNSDQPLTPHPDATFFKVQHITIEKAEAIGSLVKGHVPWGYVPNPDHEDDKVEEKWFRLPEGDGEDVEGWDPEDALQLLEEPSVCRIIYTPEGSRAKRLKVTRPFLWNPHTQSLIEDPELGEPATYEKSPAPTGWVDKIVQPLAGAAASAPSKPRGDGLQRLSKAGALGDVGGLKFDPVAMADLDLARFAGVYALVNSQVQQAQERHTQMVLQHQQQSAAMFTAMLTFAGQMVERRDAGERQPFDFARALRDQEDRLRDFITEKVEALEDEDEPAVPPELMAQLQELLTKQATAGAQQQNPDASMVEKLMASPMGEAMMGAIVQAVAAKMSGDGQPQPQPEESE